MFDHDLWPVNCIYGNILAKICHNFSNLISDSFLVGLPLNSMYFRKDYREFLSYIIEGSFSISRLEMNNFPQIRALG